MYSFQSLTYLNEESFRSLSRAQMVSPCLPWFQVLWGISAIRCKHFWSSKRSVCMVIVIYYVDYFNNDQTRIRALAFLQSWDCDSGPVERYSSWKTRIFMIKIVYHGVLIAYNIHFLASHSTLEISWSLGLSPWRCLQSTRFSPLNDVWQGTLALRMLKKFYTICNWIVVGMIRAPLICIF